MSSQSTPRWRLLPDGIRYVADSDPDALCHATGTPNIAAIARAACLSKSAFNRLATRKRPWAGGDTVLRVSHMAAKARGIPLEEAQARIFEPVEVETGVAA